MLIHLLAFENKVLNRSYSFGFIALTMEFVFKFIVLTSVKYLYDAVSTDRESCVWLKFSIVPMLMV